MSVIIKSYQVAQADLGADADYWAALADGLSSDGEWQGRLPTLARAGTLDAITTDLGGRKAGTRVMSVRRAPDGRIEFSAAAEVVA